MTSAKWMGLLAVAAAAAWGAPGLGAEPAYDEPALTIEPVGSNPRANKMDRPAFEAFSASMRTGFQGQPEG